MTRALLAVAAVLAVLLPAATAHAAFGVRAEWGGNGREPGKLDRPNGIALAPDGTVVVADSLNHRVQSFTAGGALLGAAGARGVGPAQFERPNDVAVAPDGARVVADFGNERVQVLNPDGTPRTAWTTRPAGETAQARPAGVAVAPDGTVYVTDLDGGRVLVFTPAGAPLRVLGAGALSFPSGLALAPDGTLLVADSGSHRVLRLDAGTGAVLRAYGGRGSADAQLENPTGVSARPDGAFWVADFGNGRVKLLAPDGAVREVLGGPGSPLAADVQFPIDVAAGGDGSVFLVNSSTALVKHLGETPPFTEVAPDPTPGKPLRQNDTFAPRATVTAPAPQRPLRSRRFVVTVACNEACRIDVRAYLTARGGRRATTRTVRRTLAGGQRVRLVLPLPRTALATARRALRSGSGFATVAVTTRDVAGNRGIARDGIAVRR